jgi:hypothetical protein
VLKTIGTPCAAAALATATAVRMPRDARTPTGPSRTAP